MGPKASWLLLLGRAVVWSVCGLCSTASVPAAPQADQAVLAHFRDGQQATKDGNIELAVKEYKTVLRLDPTVVEAHINLGLAYHMLGEYESAVSELATARRERPKVLGADVILGIDYLKLGQPQKAIAPLQDALTIEPSNREARRALAACYLAEGNYLQARAEFQQAFSLETDKEQAWFALGHDYLDMTTQLTSRFAQSYPNSPWRHRLAGDTLGERHLWNDAAREYQIALALEPAERGLHASLGGALLQKAEVGEAEAAFNSELRLDPYSVEALLGLAEVRLNKGDTMGAVENVSKVLDISPQFLGQADFPSVVLAPEVWHKVVLDLEKAPAQPAASFLLWAAYKGLGEAGQADKQRESFQSQTALSGNGVAVRAGITVEQAYQACQSHADGACVRGLQSRKNLTPSDYLLLGKARFALAQYENAGDSFAAALAGKSQTAEADYWLIRTYTVLAEGCFAQLMAQFPDSWRAHQLRAESDQLRQADKEAIEEYEKAVRLRPDEATLHRALGELYLAADSPDSQAKGVAELEKALQLDPGDARGLYLLGNWYVTERQPEKAVAYLQRALRYEPGLLEARVTLGKAYLRAGQAALAAPELKKAVALDRYGDIHYLLYEAYRDLGEKELAQTTLAESQELRRKSAADDQAKIKYATGTQ